MKTNHIMAMSKFLQNLGCFNIQNDLLPCVGLNSLLNLQFASVSVINIWKRNSLRTRLRLGNVQENFAYDSYRACSWLRVNVLIYLRRYRLRILK